MRKWKTRALLTNEIVVYVANIGPNVLRSPMFVHVFMPSFIKLPHNAALNEISKTPDRVGYIFLPRHKKYQPALHEGGINKSMPEFQIFKIAFISKKIILLLHMINLLVLNIPYSFACCSIHNWWESWMRTKPMTLVAPCLTSEMSDGRYWPGRVLYRLLVTEWTSVCRYWLVLSKDFLQMYK